MDRLPIVGACMTPKQVVSWKDSEGFTEVALVGGAKLLINVPVTTFSDALAEARKLGKNLSCMADESPYGKGSLMR